MNFFQFFLIFGLSFYVSKVSANKKIKNIKISKDLSEVFQSLMKNIFFNFNLSKTSQANQNCGKKCPELVKIFHQSDEECGAYIQQKGSNMCFCIKASGFPIFRSPSDSFRIYLKKTLKFKLNFKTSTEDLKGNFTLSYNNTITDPWITKNIKYVSTTLHIIEGKWEHGFELNFKKNPLHTIIRVLVFTKTTILINFSCQTNQSEDLFQYNLTFKSYDPIHNGDCYLEKNGVKNKSKGFINSIINSKKKLEYQKTIQPEDLIDIEVVRLQITKSFKGLCTFNIEALDSDYDKNSIFGLKFSIIRVIPNIEDVIEIKTIIYGICLLLLLIFSIYLLNKIINKLTLEITKTFERFIKFRKTNRNVVI